MAANGFLGRSFFSACALYFASLAAAAITELFWTIPGSGLSIWLPAGILLSVILTAQQAKWPILAAAAICAELTGNYLWYQHDLGPALMLSLGNTFTVISGALVIRSFVSAERLLTNVKDTSILLIVAGLLMPLLSATTGSIGLGWSYGRSWTEFWQRIYLGDATGAVIAAPAGLLLMHAAARPLRISSGRMREAIALVVIFGAMAAISLGGIAPFAFLMIPPLLWASLSFRIPGAIVAIVSITLFTALFTYIGLGPFARPLMYVEYQHQALQLFLIVVATTGLLIGALAEENRKGIRDLYALNHSLEDRVAERSASLAATVSKAKETANLLSAISEACPDLIFAKDLDFRIIYANSAALRVMNVKDIVEWQSIGEESLLALPQDFEAIRANDEMVLKSRETIIAEEVITDFSGGRRVYRSTKSPLYDSEGNLAGLAGVSIDISEFIKSQAREKMLMREVEHRARNLLAVVQGIVALSRDTDVAALKENLTKRIRALAHTNGAIAASDWIGADLRAILETELAPYKNDDDSNVALQGYALILEPAAAQSITLIIHELTTNAAKYGCLSAASGKLTVAWTITEDDEGTQWLELSWTEKGGPPVSTPQRQGFGTTIIGVFGQERPGSSVDLTWLTEGLSMKLIWPILPPKPQI